jgi:hypothetical protein
MLLVEVLKTKSTSSRRGHHQQPAGIVLPGGGRHDDGRRVFLQLLRNLFTVGGIFVS